MSHLSLAEKSWTKTPRSLYVPCGNKVSFGIDSLLRSDAYRLDVFNRNLFQTHESGYPFTAFHAQELPFGLPIDACGCALSNA